MKTRSSRALFIMAIVFGFVTITAVFLVGAGSMADELTDARESLIVAQRERAAAVTTSQDTKLALLDATKRLSDYELNSQCMVAKVVVEYGGFGTYLIGETELCGYNLKIGERVFGPSIQAHVEALEREIAERAATAQGSTDKVAQ